MKQCKHGNPHDPDAMYVCLLCWAEGVEESIEAAPDDRPLCRDCGLRPFLPGLTVCVLCLISEPGRDTPPLTPSDSETPPTPSPGSEPKVTP